MLIQNTFSIEMFIRWSEGFISKTRGVVRLSLLRGNFHFPIRVNNLKTFPAPASQNSSFFNTAHSNIKVVAEVGWEGLRQQEQVRRGCIMRIAELEPGLLVTLRFTRRW
jgi:hypothetical protein